MVGFARTRQRVKKVAAGILFWIPHTGVFLLTEDSNAKEAVVGLNLALLLRLVIYQAVPEMVIDTYACCLEIRGGLSAQYESYWKGQTATMISLKVAVSVMLTSFCLGISIIFR